jgi:hypothetical protein
LKLWIKIVLVTVVSLGILSTLIVYRESIFSFIQPPTEQKLTVVYGQGATVEFGDYAYAFSYLPTNQTWDKKPTLVVTTKALTTKTYTIQEGSTFNDFGVEITVLEIHEDYIIILVKQTVPN